MSARKAGAVTTNWSSAIIIQSSATDWSPLLALARRPAVTEQAFLAASKA